MRKTLTYDIEELEPYINWLYFYHAWGLSGKPQEAKDKMKAEAEVMLKSFRPKYKTKAVFLLADANSDGDDILLNGVRLPMLRQQRPSRPDEPNLCLADFVRPLSSGIKDRMGAFATTVDIRMETEYESDPYQRMLAQTLADRLAEATVEKMHQEVRTQWWGYAPDEHLTIKELLEERFQGIRPAVGYPSMPDTSVNFLLSSLLDMQEIGIRLTTVGAMKPHASVSGLMFSHPKAHYFDLGPIGEDQLRDYAHRRGVPVELMRRYLASHLE
mgnify:FL=1